MAKKVLAALGKPESLISFVKDRPGHDRRYAMDDSKIVSLGFRPAHEFERGLAETVRLYANDAKRTAAALRD